MSYGNQSDGNGNPSYPQYPPSTPAREQMVTRKKRELLEAVNKLILQALEVRIDTGGLISNDTIEHLRIFEDEIRGI